MGTTAKFWVRGVAALLVFGAIALLISRMWTDSVSTDDAVIAGHVHPISARVVGTVIEVRTDDNQHVRKGDVLVVLDSSDFGVQVEQAEAQLAQARAQVSAATSLMAQARAAITSAEVTVERTNLDFARVTGLVAEAAISRRDYDAARAAYHGAVATLDGAREALSTSSAGRQAALAQVASAEANLKNTKLTLAYTRVLAPVDGYIGRKTVEVGARVNAGQTLLSIVSDDLWIIANYKETQLRGIAINAPVEIRIDALPNLTVLGYVESFSPASGAQFSLLPPDNATGNFTKVVQRIPVKIRIQPSHLARYRAQLMPGLSVTTDIEPPSGKP